MLLCSYETKLKACLGEHIFCPRQSLLVHSIPHIKEMSALKAYGLDMA